MSGVAKTQAQAVREIKLAIARKWRMLVLQTLIDLPFVIGHPTNLSYSVTELADALGISRQTLSNWRSVMNRLSDSEFDRALSIHGSWSGVTHHTLYRKGDSRGNQSIWIRTDLYEILSQQGYTIQDLRKLVNDYLETLT
jgi:transcriptional regulator with XRE-family HTH domain